MTTPRQNALAAAELRQLEALPLLERWVRINSFTGNLDGCARMADELITGFAGIGALRCERRAGQNSGDHLAWFTPAWSSAVAASRTVLIGHYDTVFPPGFFEGWNIVDNRAHGPGVLDMKGGLVTIRTALAALHDVDALATIPLAVVIVADEETGSADSRPWLESIAAGTGAALVFEAGRVHDAIVTRRKGTGKLTVSALGRAAHAGNDLALGINAIAALARFITSAERAVNELAKTPGDVTLSVGVIAGGTSTNTVPAEAHADFDLRFIRSADAEALLARLRNDAEVLATETGARFHFDGGIRRPALEPCDASRALCVRYGNAARQEGLGSDEAGLMGGGSDANTVSAVGVPSIDGLGPRGQGFHTPEEFIELSTLQQRTRALIRFLLT